MADTPTTTSTSSTLESTRNMARDALERAGERVRDLRGGVSELTNRGMSTMTDSAQAAQRRLGEYTRATTQYVGEHPMKTALVAAAIGALVAGLVIALRRNEDRF